MLLLPWLTQTSETGERREAGPALRPAGRPRPRLLALQAPTFALHPGGGRVQPAPEPVVSGMTVRVAILAQLCCGERVSWGRCGLLWQTTPPQARGPACWERSLLPFLGPLSFLVVRI